MCIPVLCLLAGCRHSHPVPTGPVLEHRISYSAKGTRSEARHGALFYKGQAVPDVYEAVVDHQVTYRFRTRNEMWGDDGYHPGPRLDPAPPVEEGFRPADRETGWYSSSGRKPGTPADWVYVEWSGGSAFVAPDRLGVLAESQNLNPISRIGREQLLLPARR